MKLNHDFYTFSSKHFVKLANLLRDYEYQWEDQYEMMGELLRDLAERGKVSLKVKRSRSHHNGGMVSYEFIKFWPDPKHIEYFKQFDKKKLI